MKEASRDFPATMEGLADATSFLMEVLGPSAYPAKVKSSLMVAMDEIASNIVHYSGAKDFKVTISSEEDPPVVRLQFTDGGKPYNPLTQGDPDVTLSAEEREVGGLGIFMVKRMMDEITYSHDSGQNVLVIGKKCQ